MVAIVGCGLVLAVTTAAAAVAAAAGWAVFVDTYTLTNLVIGSGFLGAGGVIGWFRWHNSVGRLFLVCGLGHLLTAAAGMLVLVASAAQMPVAVIRSLVTLYAGAWQVGVAGLFLLALLLFPDGHLPSKRWRPLAWAIPISSAYQLVTGVLSDNDTPLAGDPQAQSIISVGLTVPDPITEAASVVHTAITLAVLVAVAVRYWRGVDRVRSQLQWLILAVLAILVLNTQRWITGDGPILLLLSFTLVPVAVAVAIVRHRLLDIRLVLSRTLLYLLAVSVVVAAYAGGVAAVSLLVPTAQRGLSIVVAIVVAIGFTPLRLRLQRVIDRAFYGSRSDPAGTAARIGEQMRRDDDLEGVLERARTTLRLPFLALLRDPGHGELAVSRAHGASEEVEDSAVDIVLSYRGDVVGTLRVGLRHGDQELHEDDRKTLDLLGVPLAVALHATALSEQVQLARVAIVEAGERERVRLQRDLHDGLGPSLTSIAFRADAISNVLRAEPDRAEDLLIGVRAGLRDALEDVRRVVHGLRPIDLDTLGLVETLLRDVNGLRTQRPGAPRLTVQAPVGLPPLSPALELAAYRIAGEAITNVVRHSDATVCTVTLDASDDLAIAVVDDGTPPASWEPGVGLRSITDRAEELGGSASARPTPSGWRVDVRLPLPRPGSNGAAATCGRASRVPARDHLDTAGSPP